MPQECRQQTHMRLQLCQSGVGSVFCGASAGVAGHTVCSAAFSVCRGLQKEPEYQREFHAWAPSPGGCKSEVHARVVANLPRLGAQTRILLRGVVRLKSEPKTASSASIGKKAAIHSLDDHRAQAAGSWGGARDHRLQVGTNA